MADFPSQFVPPLHISTFSTFAGTFEAVGAGSNTVASYNWPAEKRAVYVPVTIPWPYPVSRVFWANGSAAGGNMDFGIYTQDGARLYSTGATAASGNSLLQYVDPTDFLLTPGTYYFALLNDSATTTNRTVGFSAIAASEGRLGGLLQQSGIATLPSAATFAAWESTGIPLMGITRTASGF